MVGIGRAAVPQMAAGKGRALPSPFLSGLTLPEADRQAHTICQTHPTSKKYSTIYTLTITNMVKKQQLRTYNLDF